MIKFESVDKIFPFVLPYLDGAPQQAVRVAAMKMAGVFCRETLIAQTLVVNEVEKGATAHKFRTLGGKLVKVLKLWFDDEEMMETNWNMLGMDRTCSTKRLFIQDHGGVTFPDELEHDGKLTALIAVEPQDWTLPSVILDKYAMGFANGVIADVKQMAGQPFTDLQTAAVYMQMFNQAVREARVDANRSLGRETGRVQPRRVV